MFGVFFWGEKGILGRGGGIERERFFFFLWFFHFQGSIILGGLRGCKNTHQTAFFHNNKKHNITKSRPIPLPRGGLNQNL